MSDGLGWMSDRQRDGGLDRVPLPGDVAGALWLCGKHAIGPDHRGVIDAVGGEATVVCLVEPHEIDARYPAYLAWLRAEHGRAAIWWPIHDLHAPPADRMRAFVGDLIDRLRRGDTLVVHCAAGMGRAGTTAASILVVLGVEVDDALRVVATARPGAGPEVGAQRDLVDELAAG